MLKVSGISKSYEAEEVLRDVSFVLNPGERLGLVGPNGSGKSTLLRLLAGIERPDAGSVWVDPSDRVAYLPQYPAEVLGLSVREALLRGAGRVGLLQKRIGEMERRMPEVAGGALDGLLEEYAAARDEYEALGGYALDARLEAVVAGLELRGELDAPVATLSGGNKTKLGLASLLLSGASILLLDEPTNYLDLPALLWLEDWVRGSGSACIIVSHDRRFLDRTVSGILELDSAAHTLRAWPGNYSAYAEAKRAEEEKRLAAYLDQQAERRRIEDDIRRTKEQARGVELGTNLDTARRYAKKVAKKAKAREHRLERMLEENEVEKPRRSWGMDLGNLQSGDGVRDERTVLQVRDIRAGYGGAEVLCGVDLHLRGRDQVALLGANGSGKSTLLRCIAGTLPYTGEVRLGEGVRAGFLSQEADELPAGKTVLEAFRSRTVMYEDEARTFLHKFLFAGEQAHQSVGSLSYGQRAKLALAMLVSGGANFLVLDEPTSHLDMPALEAVAEAVAGYAGPLLVVSHDRYFLERIGITRTLVMEGGRLRPVAGIAEYEAELRAATAA